MSVSACEHLLACTYFQTFSAFYVLSASKIYRYFDGVLWLGMGPSLQKNNLHVHAEIIAIGFRGAFIIYA